MNNKSQIDKHEMDRRKRNLRNLKKIMIAIDALALVILIMQIKLGDVAYYSYILLIFCNFITFFARPSFK